MIRVGLALASSDSCSFEDADGMTSRTFPRLEDLPAPPFNFLDPLELVFINDYRNVLSGCFL